jgi:hypothetical protein
MLTFEHIGLDLPDDVVLLPFVYLLSTSWLIFNNNFLLSWDGSVRQRVEFLFGLAHLYNLDRLVLF